jgi:response regulator RpfG family c-di-GMP phosphodiesterase
MPLVALTGYGQESDRERVRQAGFDEHLVKPVNAERIVALFERMVATLCLLGWLPFLREKPPSVAESSVVARSAG